MVEGIYTIQCMDCNKVLGHLYCLSKKISESYFCKACGRKREKKEREALERYKQLEEFSKACGRKRETLEHKDQTRRPSCES